MNPYSFRIFLWLATTGVVTILTSEPPLIFYGITFGVISYALADNIWPPKELK